MKLVPTAIPGVVIVEPRIFRDERGFFQEVWHADRFRELGLDFAWIQDNHSRSARGTLRGLHYQVKHVQGKLVRAVTGEIFDVAVDLRRASPTFGRWVGVTLSESNHRQLWVPPGFAHGFYVTSPQADVVYKCTDTYSVEHERTLRWDDPAVGIEWPLMDHRPLLSPKDARGLSLADAPVPA